MSGFFDKSRAIKPEEIISLRNQNKPLRSWSQIAKYMRCPSEYEAQYINKTVTWSGSVHSVLGNAVHTAHEKMAEAKRDSGLILEEESVISTVTEDFNSRVEKLEEEPEEGFSYYLDKAVECSLAYRDYFKDADIHPQLIEEKLVYYPEGLSFGVRGYIDRYDENRVVVDLKTSGKKPPLDKKSGEHYVPVGSGYDLQLDLYLLMLRETKNLDPSRAKLEFVVKSSTPVVVPVYHDVNEARLKSVLDLFNRIEESIQKKSFPPNRLSYNCSPDRCSNWNACTGL